ncbi:hypothetical protein M8C21_020289 [Ambrosia artemisiifolia]|uniref:Uncharacterized protein n=1 Tax=Ambrosia artemisiifolia TaxID=4212 RepID=A0AAD5C0S7_AMBAR|nr:hypothetical protein M8C21_020289 [Ambrosia artemisiifolia]
MGGFLLHSSPNQKLIVPAIHLTNIKNTTASFFFCKLYLPFPSSIFSLFPAMAKKTQFNNEDESSDPISHRGIEPWCCMQWRCSYFAKTRLFGRSMYPWRKEAKAFDVNTMLLKINQHCECYAGRVVKVVCTLNVKNLLFGE